MSGCRDSGRNATRYVANAEGMSLGDEYRALKRSTFVHTPSRDVIRVVSQTEQLLNDVGTTSETETRRKSNRSKTDGDNSRAKHSN